MGSSVVGSSNPKDFSQIGIDANASSNSNAFDIGMAINVIVQVLANTGTHVTHIIQLQCSIDGTTDWEDMAGITITGLGATFASPVAARFVRVRVSTVEGGVSTVDIKVQAK